MFNLVEGLWFPFVSILFWLGFFLDNIPLLIFGFIGGFFGVIPVFMPFVLVGITLEKAMEVVNWK